MILICAVPAIGLLPWSVAVSSDTGLPANAKVVRASGPAAHGGYVDRKTGMRVRVRKVVVRSFVYEAICERVGRPEDTISFYITVRNLGKRDRDFTPPDFEMWDAEGSTFIEKPDTESTPPIVKKLHPGGTFHSILTFYLGTLDLPWSFQIHWTDRYHLLPSRQIASYTLGPSGYKVCP